MQVPAMLAYAIESWIRQIDSWRSSFYRFRSLLSHRAPAIHVIRALLGVAFCISTYASTPHTYPIRILKNPALFRDAGPVNSWRYPF